MKPPTLELTRDGVSNFAEIAAWADKNVPLWHSAETVRRVHGLSRTEWLEFLVASLVLANEELREAFLVAPIPPIRVTKDMDISELLPPAAVLPETRPLAKMSKEFLIFGDPTGDDGYPIPQAPTDSRFGVAVLIGLAFTLALAAGFIGLVLHEHPAFWGTCAAASGACFWRASVAGV